MNSIKNGQIYEAKQTHSGEDWEMIITQDEKGQHEIVLYASNRPSHVEEGKMFKVSEIKGISYGSKQDRQGNWRPNVRLYAVVEPA